MKTASLAAEGNIITLTPTQRPARPLLARPRPRFKIIAFINKRTKSESWRVSGIKRDGTRIRQNFSDPKAAQHRHVELEAEWLARETDSNLRSTRLTENQVGIAEACFQLLDEDGQLMSAVQFWLANGKQEIRPDAPRLDQAFEEFKAALEADQMSRPLTKMVNRLRVASFVNATPNLRISEITPEVVEKFLDGIKGTQRTRINNKAGVSRFLSWCMDRPRRWILTNPCTAIRIQIGERPPPEILKVEDCEALMRAAENFKEGKLVPYFAVTMFDGLRPFEARRLAWDQINFEDGEIRIEGSQTKTKRPRAFTLSKTTLAWLRAHHGKPFMPKNFANEFPVFIRKQGFGTKTETEPHLRAWPKDLLRHTAISHYFRLTGSYGQTAERFGNSEAIIKRHYQSRVTSEETKRFYGILPKKGGRK